MYNGARVLVTGGSGFIDTNLIGVDCSIKEPAQMISDTVDFKGEIGIGYN